MFLSFRVLCAEDKIIVSPGVKLGYAFGEKGGFVLGFEISIVRDPGSYTSNNIYGAVLSFERMKSEYRFHIGAQMNFSKYEGAWKLLGLEIGPTYILRDTNNALGINVTPYFGGFIIPYYRLLIVPQEYIQHEVGSFIKLPLPIKGNYSLGG